MLDYFSFRTQVADMKTRLEPSSLELTLIQRYNIWTALVIMHVHIMYAGVKVYQISSQAVNVLQ